MLYTFAHFALTFHLMRLELVHQLFWVHCLAVFVSLADEVAFMECTADAAVPRYEFELLAALFIAFSRDRPDRVLVPTAKVKVGDGLGLDLLPLLVVEKDADFAVRCYNATRLLGLHGGPVLLLLCDFTESFQIERHLVLQQFLRQIRYRKLLHVLSRRSVDIRVDSSCCDCCCGCLVWPAGRRFRVQTLLQIREQSRARQSHSILGLSC